MIRIIVQMAMTYVEDSFEGDKPKPAARQGKDLDYTAVAGMENRGEIPESFRLWRLRKR